MNALGRFGEDHAARWLRSPDVPSWSGVALRTRGDRPHHTGWRGSCLCGGQDPQPDYLVRPAEAVGPAKRRKLIETALYYTMEHPEYSGYQPRFDVMEIVAQPADGSWSILEQAYWKGAFDVNGSL
ncbi:MAG: YraN family protein [Acutalibacteraceae bacterium]